MTTTATTPDADRVRDVMRARAEAWLQPSPGDSRDAIDRHNASGEEHMALDVLEMLRVLDERDAEIARLTALGSAAFGELYQKAIRECGEEAERGIKLQARMQALTEALRKYGRHIEECAEDHGGGRCTCGLVAALEAK